jgi:hypothetical protein
VSYSPWYHLAVLKLVISPDGHERAMNNAIRCVEYNRTGPFSAQKLLHRFRRTVEIVLWATTPAACFLGLLKVRVVTLDRDRSAVNRP